jgi:AcrR family transcriptional regulator
VPSRIDRAAATRDRLLVAARERFTAHGFDGTSLRDVATAANVAVGTVFVHFADKADLLHAVLHDALERTLDVATAPPPGPLLARLQFVADTVFDHYEAEPALSRALLQQSMLATGPWAQKFAAQHARVHGVIVTLVEQARGTEIRHDVDAGVFALAFLSFFQFALLSWVQQVHPEPRRWIARLLRQHVDGVALSAPAIVHATTPRSTP